MPRHPPRARAAPGPPNPLPGLQPHGTVVNVPAPAAAASAAALFGPAVTSNIAGDALLAHVLARIGDLSKKQGASSFEARCSAVGKDADRVIRTVTKARDSIANIRNDSTKEGLLEVATAVDKIALAAQQAVKDLSHIRPEVMEAASVQDIREKLDDVESMILSFVEDSSTFLPAVVIAALVSLCALVDGPPELVTLLLSLELDRRCPRPPALLRVRLSFCFPAGCSSDIQERCH